MKRVVGAIKWLMKLGFWINFWFWGGLAGMWVLSIILDFKPEDWIINLFILFLFALTVFFKMLFGKITKKAF